MTKGTITVKDVYDVVNRLEDKMDKKFEDHEGRLNKLEDVGSRILAVWGVISFVATALFTWAWNRLTKNI